MNCAFWMDANHNLREAGSLVKNKVVQAGRVPDFMILNRMARQAMSDSDENKAARDGLLRAVGSRSILIHPGRVLLPRPRPDVDEKSLQRKGTL